MVLVIVSVIVLSVGVFFIYPETQNWKSAKQEIADAEKRVAELKAGRKSLLTSDLPADKAGVDSESPSTSLGAPLDTSGWKTYRNEKYGFLVRFPGNMTETGKMIWTKISNSDEFEFSIKNSTLEDFEYSDSSADVRYIFDINKRWTYGVSDGYFNTDIEMLRRLIPKVLDTNFEAYRYEGGVGFCAWNSYFIPKRSNKIMIVITYQVCGNPPNKNSMESFKVISPKILSTFRFLE